MQVYLRGPIKNFLKNFAIDGLQTCKFFWKTDCRWKTDAYISYKCIDDNWRRICPLFLDSIIDKEEKERVKKSILD